MSYRVGAVAYHPRVVTIWEDFRRWFAGRDFELDYTLFSTYEEQVEALFAGAVDVAWNTNLAYVQVRARSRGACRALAMRDNDRDWTSHLVVRAGSAAAGLDALRGKRVGFGDSDSPQAWILPAWAMRREGVDPDRDLQADRLDYDLGKHGDTGRAELAQVERLRAVELDGCVVSNWTLKALREEGADDLAVAWTSPPFHHCNFTSLDSSTAAHDDFRALLLGMDAADPALCEAMRLENVGRWVEGDETGYAGLIEALGS